MPIYKCKDCGNEKMYESEGVYVLTYGKMMIQDKIHVCFHCGHGLVEFSAPRPIERVA